MLSRKAAPSVRVPQRNGRTARAPERVIAGQRFRGQLASCPRAAASTDASATVSPAEAALDTLRRAAARPGAVRPSEIVQSLVALEKAKLKPDGWAEKLEARDTRWRLVYTLPAKDVTAAAKKQPGGSGGYFPLSACQKFDGTDFENGVFLGPVGSLTFKGPYRSEGRVLHFDVTTMFLGLGPWRLAIPIKKEVPLKEMDTKTYKKLPFFVYAYVGDDVIVARGRSGGVALWGRADADWLASAGALQIYK